MWWIKVQFVFTSGCTVCSYCDKVTESALSEQSSQFSEAFESDSLIYLWLGTHDSNIIRMRGEYCELVGGWKWNTTGNKVLQGKVYSRCGWCMSGIIFKWFFFCANGIRGWVISITTDSQRQGGSDTHVIWCCTREHTAILCLQQKRTLAPYKLCFVPAKFVTEWLVVCSSRF